jgi:hypothetical protein
MLGCWVYFLVFCGFCIGFIFVPILWVLAGLFLSWVFFGVFGWATYVNSEALCAFLVYLEAYCAFLIYITLLIKKKKNRNELKQIDKPWIVLASKG